MTDVLELPADEPAPGARPAPLAANAVDRDPPATVKLEQIHKIPDALLEQMTGEAWRVTPWCARTGRPYRLAASQFRSGLSICHPDLAPPLLPSGAT